MASPHLALSERFVQSCAPAIGTNYDTCGTVTRAEIEHMSVDDLAGVFLASSKYRDMDAFFMHSIEMKACGTRIYGLYEWIMANADTTNFRAAVSGIKTVKGDSLLHPFIMGKQDSVISRDYWSLVLIHSTYLPGDPPEAATEAESNIVDGDLAASGVLKENGATPVTADCTLIRVKPKYDLPVDVNWFRPREIVSVFSASAGGAATHGLYRIVVAKKVTISSVDYIDLAVLPTNPSGTQTAPADAITEGIVIVGSNNVGDTEKWCQNLPTIDGRKRVPFWVQTYRNSRCVDSEYRKVFARLMTSNAAFREFGDLDLSERNRQDEHEAQRRFVHAFLFNKPISTNQTLTNWESLEPIYTVEGNGLKLGLNGKIMGRRANWVGVKEQLNKCGRLYDMANAAFDMDDFLDLNYRIYRARTSSGRKVTDIDWFTDSQSRVLLHKAFVKFYAWLGGGTTGGDSFYRINLSDNDKASLGMTWDTYRVPRPGGVNINIISNEFFDDFRAQFSGLAAARQNRGKLLLCLDIGKPGPNGGTIYYANIASNRKVYQTAQIDQLAKLDSTFKCVMEHVSDEQTLTSMTGTVVVECPQHSAWIENWTTITDADGALASPTPNFPESDYGAIANP